MLIIIYGGNMRKLSWIMETYHQILYKSGDFIWQDPWNDVTQLWLKRVVVRFHIPRQAFQDPVLRSGKKFMGCLVKIGASILVASWDLMSRFNSIFGWFHFLSLKGAMKYAEDGLWKKGTPGHRLLSLGFLHSYLLKAKNPWRNSLPSPIIYEPTGSDGLICDSSVQNHRIKRPGSCHHQLVAMSWLSWRLILLGVPKGRHSWP
jgi:hypothetical protein